MENVQPQKIDIDEVIRQKAPGKRIPRVVVNYLKKIVHQEDINQYLAQVAGQKNVKFADSTLKKFDITLRVEGVENLPPKNGKYIFVSNHPLGGLDGVTLGKVLGEHYEGKVKFFANDFLMFLEPLKEMFIPVNKVGAQSRDISRITDEFFQSDNHLITFPAGACSRKIHGVIQDFEWKKTFVAKAIQYQRDVVPVYFEARNSNFFYNLANWRTRLGVKINVEMLYLADEMYKQRGKTFRIVIGKRIPHQTFDKTKTPTEWAAWVRGKVYGMK